MPVPEARALPVPTGRRRKYYAVARGHQVGVFHTDEDARKAYEGYSGAKHKGFTNILDVEQYVERWKFPTATPSPTTSKPKHITYEHYPAGHGAGLCDVSGSLAKKFMRSLSKKRFQKPVQPSALPLLQQQAGFILAMNQIEAQLDATLRLD